MFLFSSQDKHTGKKDSEGRAVTAALIQSVKEQSKRYASHLLCGLNIEGINSRIFSSVMFSGIIVI